MRHALAIVLALGLAQASAAQVTAPRAPVAVDLSLEKRASSVQRGLAKASEAFLVETRDGRIETFASGRAILHFPPNANIEEHLAATGLTRMGPGPHGNGEYAAPPQTSPALLRAEYERRLGRLTEPSRAGWITVRLPMSGSPRPWRDEATRRDWAGLVESKVSNEGGYSTLAFVAEHRARFEQQGFLLELDAILPPRSFLASTIEGNPTFNPVASSVWRIAGLDRGWRLAQVSAVRKLPNPWGPNVVIAVVDRGFATSATELSPIWSVGDIGQADPDPDDGSTYHGTKVTSVAAAPVNDSIGGAGTAFKSQHSVLTDLLDPGGSIAYIWVRCGGMRFSDWAHSIDLAVLAVADVINISMGGQCGGWCRKFAWVSGLSALRSSLEFAAEFETPVVVSAGNDSEDLDSDGSFYVPCEMAGDLTVCVGAIDGAGAIASFSNYGDGVDVFAPGVTIPVGPTPGSAAVQSFSGTSASAPFVTGGIATGLLLKGAPISNGEARATMRSTGAPGADPRVRTVVDFHRFFQTYATVIPDRHEPNDYGWQAAVGIPSDALLTIHARPNGLTDEDWYYLPPQQVPRCGSVEFDIEFLPNGSWEPLVRTDRRLNWSPGVTTGPHARHFEIEPIESPSLTLGVKGSNGSPTGYTIRNVKLLPNGVPNGEGPQHPTSCNGRDDDCDAGIDEGFPDTDGDGIADCVDEDDDNDCVADAADNCPSAANATQFCPEATGPGAASPYAANGCGDRACYGTVKPYVVAGLEMAIVGCFGAVPIDPACFDDGCPTPGPLIFDDIRKVMENAQEVVDSIPRPVREKDERWRREVQTLTSIRYSPQGLAVLPAKLASRQGVPGTPRVARAMSAAELPRCKPLLLLGPRLSHVLDRGQQANRCWENVAQRPCQADSDGDGIGDACDPN